MYPTFIVIDIGEAVGRQVKHHPVGKTPRFTLKMSPEDKARFEGKKPLIVASPGTFAQAAALGISKTFDGTKIVTSYVLQVDADGFDGRENDVWDSLDAADTLGYEFAILIIEP